MQINKIGQIAIAVNDIADAVLFYRDTLGLPLLFEAPPGLAFFDCAGVRLMLTTPQGDAKDHNTSVIYYQVEDIHQSCAELKRAGVEFEREAQMAAQMPDHELWIGFLRDPDQNLVGIMAEMPVEQS